MWCLCYWILALLWPIFPYYVLILFCNGNDYFLSLYDISIYFYFILLGLQLRTYLAYVISGESVLRFWTFC